MPQNPTTWCRRLSFLCKGSRATDFYHPWKLIALGVVWTREPSLKLQARNWRREFWTLPCEVSLFILRRGFYYASESYDMMPTAFLPLWRKSCYGFLSPLKINRPTRGLNPRTFVEITSTITITPPRTKRRTLPLGHHIILRYLWKPLETGAAWGCRLHCLRHSSWRCDGFSYLFPRLRMS
jgi:hypothetical protein